MPNTESNLSQEFLDRLAYDLILGKDKEKIARHMTEKKVDDVYEKLFWFEMGMLCCRRLVGMDKKWYEKAIERYRTTARKDQFLKLEYRRKLIKNAAWGVLLLMSAVGCFVGNHFAENRHTQLLALKLLPIAGFVAGAFGLVLLVWAVRHWKGLREA